MSHQPERKERDCLNCGTIVEGRFCHVCGQENVVTHQNIWSLTKHFIFDVFHFDGKFLDTLRFLLFKPGFVAREYVSGKRAKYLDPIRMYLFTSAVFFLIFFSITHFNPNAGEIDKWVILSNADRKEMAGDYTEDLKNNPKDTLLKQKIALLLDTSRSVKLGDVFVDKGLKVNNRIYYSTKEYDSVQMRLPKKERHNWFMQRVFKKGIEIKKKHGGNFDSFMESIANVFIHRFPYILFISLPFFAGILKLLYFRRKSFYYSDHAVFTIYHYIFSFIILLLFIGSVQLADWSGWGIFGWIAFALIVSWFVYLYKGLRSFYRQSRSKTFAKFTFLIVIGLLFMILLFSLFFIFTALQF